ncbi:MAG: glycosyltransferase family 2 protein [Muribaculaceae bacterium]|nr:glycosyltransferase family 2 protein [Muribaculaceae bacterium]
MLSVICPIYNEEKYIGACIESILSQDYPKDDLEVIFADGMSTDKTRDIVKSYAVKYPWIKLIDNPDRIVPPALNKAIDVASGDVIMRLDAHAEYPHNYFSELTKQLKLLNADNVGAVCVTLPTNNTATSRAIASVLSSKFGMGDSSFRVGAKDISLVDTVPFGCWPRSVFDRIGKFDLDLIRNQDDEFNGRLTKAGGKIYLLPHVEIKYFARDKISKVAKMFYQYGLFKPLVNKKLGSPATIRQFIPLALVSGLIFGLVLSLLWPPFTWLYGLGISIYLLLALLFSAKSSCSLKQILIQTWTYIVVHICYGTGYIVGIWKLITHQSFNVQNNR